MSKKTVFIFLGFPPTPEPYMPGTDVGRKVFFSLGRYPEIIKVAYVLVLGFKYCEQGFL
jgi:hypothetical protein